MQNFIPYLILVAISMIALCLLLSRKRAVWPLILLLSFSGMIYVFEFFIFVYLDSYSYFPHIVRISYYDNVLGAIVSNLLTVPVSAAYIAVYQLSWRWIVCLAFGYGCIEWLFLRLGIYEHHWWHTAYTVLTLIFFFRFARQWLIWLSGSQRLIRLITLWMYAWSIIGSLVFLLALSGIRLFHIGFFDDAYHDDIFVSAIYGFFKAMVLAVGVTVSRGTWKSVASLLVIFALHIALMWLGILKILVPLWQYSIIYIPCCFFVWWLVSVGSQKLEQFRAE